MWLREMVTLLGAVLELVGGWSVMGMVSQAGLSCAVAGSRSPRSMLVQQKPSRVMPGAAMMMRERLVKVVAWAGSAQSASLVVGLRGLRT